MKKILLMFFFIITIVGCSCKKDVIIKLPKKAIATESDSSSYLYGEYNLLSYELASTEEYDVLIENKESFLLFVYNETCGGCKLLSPALAAYVDEYEVGVYTLSNDKISDKHDLYEAGVNTTPFLIIIENGEIKLIELVLKLKNNEPEKNKEWIKNWINKHVEWSEN